MSEVWGTGEDVRDFIYVDDMVEATVRAMEKIKSYPAINIGLGRGYRIKDILQLILELDGYTNASVVFNPAKPTMIPIHLIDTTRAKAHLGFKVATDLRTGLVRTIEWNRESRGISTN